MKGGGGLCPGNAPWGERQVGNPHNTNIVISDVDVFNACVYHAFDFASHCSG